MIQKYVYGKPFTTEAVVKEVAVAAGTPAYGSIETEQGFRFTYKMEENGSASKHVLRMSEYYNHLNQLGVNLPDKIVVD